MGVKQGEKSKNKGGRPAKSADGVLSKTMAFRLRPSLEDQLRRSALLEGRSMSEEVEARLNRSMQREATLNEMFGSAQDQSILIAIGNVVRLVNAMTGELENSPAQVRAAIIRLIEELSEKAASEVLEEASKAGDMWQEAASRVALLEKGALKSLREIMGR